MYNKAPSKSETVNSTQLGEMYSPCQAWTCFPGTDVPNFGTINAKFSCKDCRLISARKSSKKLYYKHPSVCVSVLFSYADAEKREEEEKRSSADISSICPWGMSLKIILANPLSNSLKQL